MTTLGSRIRARRRELGWIHEELCERAQISGSFLSSLENDKCSVSANTLCRIAAALSVSLGFLMTGTGEPLRSGVETILPGSLVRFGRESGIGFREVVLLQDLMRTIMERRPVGKRAELEGMDWARFYEAVKPWL